MAQNQVFTPGNNRSVVRGPDCTMYALHNTIVVTVYDNGNIRLDSGGWTTPTTQRAMTQVANQFGHPFKVYSKKGKWYVHWPAYSTDPKHDREFFDGMLLDSTPREV